MRSCLLLFVGAVLFTQVGCTRSLLGVLLAPEAVVGGAVSDLANSGAETLSGMSVDQLANNEATAVEIDRLLQNNPDAVNAGRLKELQDSLRGTIKHTGPEQLTMAKELPAPRRAMDKKLPIRKGDLFTVKTPGRQYQQRRPVMRPYTQPTSSSIKPEYGPAHTMSISPVRVY